jgi:hypothetical protein
MPSFVVPLALVLYRCNKPSPFFKEKDVGDDVYPAQVASSGQSRSLFEREPLGWNFQTGRHLFEKTLSLPSKIPQFIKAVIEHGRMLGIFGSLLIIFFDEFKKAGIEIPFPQRDLHIRSRNETNGKKKGCLRNI